MLEIEMEQTLDPEKVAELHKKWKVCQLARPSAFAVAEPGCSLAYWTAGSRLPLSWHRACAGAIRARRGYRCQQEGGKQGLLVRDLQQAIHQGRRVRQPPDLVSWPFVTPAFAAAPHAFLSAAHAVCWLPWSGRYDHHHTKRLKDLRERDRKQKQTYVSLSVAVPACASSTSAPLRPIFPLGAGDSPSLHSVRTTGKHRKAEPEGDGA